MRENVLFSRKLVIPLYRLQSCGTCKEVLRHCSQLCLENSQQKAGVLFLKHNIWNDFDDLTDVARMYKAKAVPSFIFLTGGAMVSCLRAYLLFFFLLLSDQCAFVGIIRHMTHNTSESDACK